MEDVLVSKDFGTILYGYAFFVNDDKEGTDKGDPNKEGYQGPPYSPEIYEIIDNSDEERSSGSCGQYIGSEVLLPEQKDEKPMGEFSKRVIYDDINTGEVNCNAMYKKSLYEVEYCGGITEQLTANIIAENILSQVDHEGHHYQVLNEVTDHKKW